jgi:hypothetical protein
MSPPEGVLFWKIRSGLRMKKMTRLTSPTSHSGLRNVLRVAWRVPGVAVSGEISTEPAGEVTSTCGPT